MFLGTGVSKKGKIFQYNPKEQKVKIIDKKKNLEGG